MTIPRVVQPLRLDASQLSPAERRKALAGFVRLNQVGRVAAAVYTELVPHARAVRGRPLRVLDLASGSGDLPLAWMRMAKRDRLQLQVTMLDRSELAIDIQQAAARRRGVEPGMLQRDCLTEPLPTGFDVVTCTQFMHSLDDQQVVRLLQSMQASAARAVIVCDWERSRLNLWWMGVVSRIVSRSRVTHRDTAAAIRGAYTASEFAWLAESTLLRQVRRRGLLSSRYLVAIDDLVETVPHAAFA